MKKLILGLCITGLMVVQTANASPVPDSTKDMAGRKAVTAEHLVGPCRFKIANMYGGEFKVSGRDSSPPQGVYYLPETGPTAFLDGAFGLACHDASDEQLSIALNGKYVDGRWLRYGPVNGSEFVPYEKQANARTIPLNGRNWTGMAYVEDDTTGDERRRARVFHFCLIHSFHALCGYTVVKWLKDRTKPGDLDRIKVILESVEFVDTPAPAGAGVAPPDRPDNSWADKGTSDAAQRDVTRCKSSEPTSPSVHRLDSSIERQCGVTFGVPKGVKIDRIFECFGGAW